MPSQIWILVKGVFVPFLKLEQAHCSEQLTMKKFVLKTHMCLNKEGVSWIYFCYIRKLRTKTADQMAVERKNTIEQRWAKWTTFSNLNLQFDTWEGSLIKLGFTRRKRADEECKKSRVLFKGYTEHIINLDKTDGALDKTCRQWGGRMIFIFNSEYINGGASLLNKTSYSPTSMVGSITSVTPLPVHSQLESLTQNDNGQQVSLIFLLT